MSSKSLESDEKGVNVKVVVRSRPLNSAEKREGTPAVVRFDQARNEVHVNQLPNAKKRGKTYTFDNAFGMYATQAEVYEATVRPIVREVLDGFNCTVFAYGQTGTGKTHTMTGQLGDDIGMGIIPRAVTEIFEFMRERNIEFSIKVSYLELYNEVLQDLLTPDDDKKPLRIVEDARRGVMCQNIDEVLVNSPEEIYHLLELASERRSTAETLMNKHSSRSHSLFSLTVHLKETTPEGEDLMKTGKLNLVDLAGSECIGRSGAKKARAREAGNINQSLLTLGRVITALVEHWPHVPYRDSKLTRLLQESLGGKAKTCIIATLSPGLSSLEETLSTLDYAARAKHIRNKPEVNQRMTKRTLIKEFTQDIERLKQELNAAREKDGVFLPKDRYDALMLSCESSSTQVQELEGALSARQAEFEELQEAFGITKAELEAAQKECARTRAELDCTSRKLGETEGVLEETKTELEEKHALLEARIVTEDNLHGEATAVVSTLTGAASDVDGLHEKIGRKEDVEQHNSGTVESFMESTKSSLSAMRADQAAFAAAHRAELEAAMESTTAAQVESKALLSDAEVALRARATRLSDSLKELSKAALEADQRQAKTADAESTRIGDSFAALFAAVSANAREMQAHCEAVAALAAAEVDNTNQRAATTKAALASVSRCAMDHTEAQLAAIETFEKQIGKDVSAIVGSVQRAQAEMDAAAQKEREEARVEALALQQQVASLVEGFAARRQSVALERDGFCKKSLGEVAAAAGQIEASTLDWRSRQVARMESEEPVFATTVDGANAAAEAQHTGSLEYTKAARAVILEHGSKQTATMASFQELAEGTKALVDGSVESLRAESRQFCEAACAITNKVLDEVASTVNEHTEALADVEKRGVSAAASLKERITVLAASTTANREAGARRIEGLEAGVSSFAASLRTDVPTGRTPTRKQYGIPSSLPRTDADAVVLERFRARKAAEEIEKADALSKATSVEDVVIDDAGTPIAQGEVEDCCGEEGNENELTMAEDALDLDGSTQKEETSRDTSDDEVEKKPISPSSSLSERSGTEEDVKTARRGRSRIPEPSRSRVARSKSRKPLRSASVASLTSVASASSAASAVSRASTRLSTRSRPPSARSKKASGEALTSTTSTPLSPARAQRRARTASRV